jgi:hypothetical protein
MILSGLCGAAMLALSFDFILRLGSGIGGLCDLAAVVLATVFFRLIDRG